MISYEVEIFPHTQLLVVGAEICTRHSILVAFKMSGKYYRYRKDEVFKRLKVTTFAQLVLQVASVSDLNESMGNEELQAGDEVSDTADGNHFSDPNPQSNKLTDTNRASNTAFSPRSTLQSFPITNLSRTMNPYTKNVLDYRNVQGKIIILYDEDERIASQAAETMCQRGFDNLFMLSGGLKVIAQRFPEGMTTGSFPTSCLPAPTGPLARKHSALRQTPQPAENKQRFTSEDLNKIQNYLDDLFVSNDNSSRLSSRMSVSSTTSNISSARSSRLGSSSARSQSRHPWK
ncbi:Centrosomal protein of 41 kDa [Bagarius yarrelli]|uniref:Centrosomal protein of 41 kDa n=1 Tax=Bagarius yarrelli TaxID=175774 RepID=A0A556V2L5_BAGYA|nr:Centrosomal protein of 41 kDa [Bagarius yarrelli]